MAQVGLVCAICVGLFCFKRKTAYEMRISDWSSDVCSSDLLVAAFDEDGGEAALRHEALLIRHHHLIGAPAMQGVAVEGAVRRLVRQPRIEIGRASCRARACQYV